jgi:peptidoglycan/LPS O-acetylase OafA/YrhL
MTSERSHSNKTPVHRADIDGLRSFAIMPVLAYHAGIHLVSGGFVGVDIFFVISGFLITQVLVRDFESERFSLIAFYERRVRRILPALIVVMLVTTAVYFYYSLPAEFIDYSKSLMTAALSVSNVFFWLSSSYFDPASADRPLLHTWSLGVEEQFYVFWPLLLMVGYRWFRGRLLLAVTILTVVSFVVSVYGVFHDRSATFYLVHTRAWELFGGALLSIGAFSKPLGRATREILGLLGLALIVGSIFLINQLMPFPGATAFPPCLGAALVILAGRDGDSTVSRIMSLKPLVFIGLISYSLYLWHWPIIVFQHNYALLMTGGSEFTRKVVEMVVSIVMATLSWWFVEQPFRFGRHRPARAPLFRYAAVATAILLALGGAGIALRGVPSRYTAHELWVANYHDKIEIYRTGHCFIVAGVGPSDRLENECIALDPNRKNMLLIGDSHAAELWYGLQQAFPDINFMQATAADCYPTIVHKISELSSCNAVMDNIFQAYLPSHHVDRVIIAARWREDILGNLEQTIDELQRRGLPVTVVGPTMVFDSSFTRLLVRAERSHDVNSLNRHWDRSLLPLNDRMAKMVRGKGAEYIDMIALAQEGGSIPIYADNGSPVLFDQEHFRVAGSVMMGQRIRAQVHWDSPRPATQEGGPSQRTQ